MNGTVSTQKCNTFSNGWKRPLLSEYKSSGEWWTAWSLQSNGKRWHARCSQYRMQSTASSMRQVCTNNGAECGQNGSAAPGARLPASTGANAASKVSGNASCTNAMNAMSLLTSLQSGRQ